MHGADVPRQSRPGSPMRRFARQFEDLLDQLVVQEEAAFAAQTIEFHPQRYNQPLSLRSKQNAGNPGHDKAAPPRLAPTIGFVHHQHAVGLAGLQERDRFRFTGVQLAVLSQVRSLGQCLRRNLNPTL